MRKMVWGKREDSWWNSEYVDSVTLGLLKKLILYREIGGLGNFNN